MWRNMTTQLKNENLLLLRYSSTKLAFDISIWIIRTLILVLVCFLPQPNDQFIICKVHIICTLRRPHNFAKSSPCFWLTLHRTKVRWRFRKISWPSQNLWTLISIKTLLQRFKWNYLPATTLISHELQSKMSASRKSSEKKVDGIVYGILQLSGWNWIEILKPSDFFQSKF